MYYSRPFKHQDRGGGGRGGRGRADEDESGVSGAIDSFSKALGESKG